MTAVVIVVALVLASTTVAIAAPAHPAPTLSDSTATHPPDARPTTAAPNESNASLAAWPVPAHLAEDATASTLRRYRPANATNVTIEPDEALVVRVRDDGLEDVVATQNGNRTERVLAGLNATDCFGFYQRMAAIANHPVTPWLNASNVDVHRADAPDAYLLVVHADRVAVRSRAAGIQPDADLEPSDLSSLYGDGYATHDPDDWRAWLNDTAEYAITLHTAGGSDHVERVHVGFERSIVPVPSDENASVAAWRIPHYVDTPNATATEFARHHDSQPSDPPLYVTPDDALAVAVSAPGLDARVANVSGNPSANLTTRAFDALEASGRFGVVQTQETTPPNLQLGTLWLNATNTRVVDGPGEDRYLLVADTSSVLLARVGVASPRSTMADAYAAGEDYRFDSLYRHPAGNDRTFTARYYANDSASGLVAESRRVQFRPAVASVAADAPLEPVASATITGTTTVAPGTELVVEARTDAGVVASAVATVDDRGRYAASLDLADVDAPATANVTVAPAANRSRTLTDPPATLPVRERRAVIAFDDQRTSMGYVSARANLSHGGVLVLRNDTTVLDERRVLEPGDGQTVTFLLPDGAANGTYRVVAYRVDDDGERGERYPNGTASANLTVVPETTTTTTTPPTTATTTAPPTTTTRTATDDAATTPVAEDPIPGFGVGVALVALAATLLVVGRRRHEN